MRHDPKQKDILRPRNRATACTITIIVDHVSGIMPKNLGANLNTEYWGRGMTVHAPDIRSTSISSRGPCRRGKRCVDTFCDNAREERGWEPVVKDSVK
jgi:hypothetical protein